MVRTRAYQIWKLRVKDQPSGRSSPMVQTREALYGNYLQWTYDSPDDLSSRPDAALKQERAISDMTNFAIMMASSVTPSNFKLLRNH
jgi:hypothetical protein